MIEPVDPSLRTGLRALDLAQIMGLSVIFDESRLMNERREHDLAEVDA